MMIKQALVGLMHLVLVVFFLGLGVFLLALFFIPEISVLLVRALQNDLYLFGMIGFCSVGFSLLLGAIFFAMGRRRTLFLRMNTSVDLLLLRQMLGTLFQQQFSGHIALRDVHIFRGKELTIGLQFISGKVEEERLLEVERHLKKFLMERFGYSEPFFVQAS